MFEKLKVKFILINMSLLTIVFIFIFGGIYTYTFLSMNRDIEHELQRNIFGMKKPGLDGPMLAGNIIIDISSDNELINVLTYAEIDEEILEDGVYKILKSEDNFSKIKLNNTRFAYLKEASNKGMRIMLINIEAQINALINLIKAFLTIGIISLFVLLFISIYLTNKTIKPLKESFEKQKQFIADASHELKTPLAIIRTNTSVILSNKEASVSNNIKWLNYISNQTERMGKLIDEMLTLAKLDNLNEKTNFISFNFSDLINNILLTFEAIIFENNIKLQSYIEDDIHIKGDKENIKKVFIILLDNAIKYTNNNGEIYIELKQDKNKIKLIVKNTGDGIKEEDLEKIFERFYRVDDSRERKTGGYGLGLSIAKSIVEAHKGKIYAKSNLKEDTSFVVELQKE